MYNDIDKSAKVNKKVKASLKRHGDGKKFNRSRGHLTKVGSAPVGMITPLQAIGNLHRLEPVLRVRLMMNKITIVVP